MCVFCGRNCVMCMSGCVSECITAYLCIKRREILELGGRTGRHTLRWCRRVLGVMQRICFMSTSVRTFSVHASTLHVIAWVSELWSSQNTSSVPLISILITLFASNEGTDVTQDNPRSIPLILVWYEPQQRRQM